MPPPSIPGTLRSGKEFSTHGAILLEDFDVLEHLHAVRSKNNKAENARDDHPIVVPHPPTPNRHDRPSARSRSCSPPRRSPRTESIDRAGQTRAARRASEQTRLGTPLKRVVRKHVANAQPIAITTTPQEYPVTSTGWGGIRERTIDQTEYTLAELQERFGMQIISNPCPLVDKESRVIPVLGGRPNDPEYLRLTQQAADELESARATLKFRPEQTRGRCGISFGGGQQVPGNLALPSATSMIFQQLFAMACFFCIAGFANRLFQTWNPAVHTLYVAMLDALMHDYNQSLRRNFYRRFSAFAAATLNFGLLTVTLPHIDTLNLAWGWCTITALGFFNPDPGGHLVLWDLKLIIRFPPGSIILIPSAILRHSNVGIGPNERRYSFTQFTAAGLFRWVDNGFRSDLTVTEQIRDDPEAQAQSARARQTRWMDGINSFQTWSGVRT
ncbi:hypothetical protein B0H13DRAFT_1907427 [Mycena leptocephala]|nr:hypothetical protein B0H13DRAFT_1907427 [Mycena leptocephala]